MNEEQQIREALIRWAKRYWVTEYDDPTPDVEVISLAYNSQDDEWEAELSVSTSADNPFVTFWTDDVHQMEENWLHIERVEY